jgi:glycosyltransferase involved in cell wall biosynthesis
VIHNAPDVSIIKAANSNFWDSKFGKNTEVWSCAASWRPHKRLDENIRYFLEFAPKDAIFAIAGALSMDDAKKIPSDERIKLMGDLDYLSLLSLYKRSTTFVHLAYLDHCPNVVVDAQAAGCKIVCSMTGGTNEIVSDGILIHEDPWDYRPIKLYEPPRMKWIKIEKKIKQKQKPTIKKCAEKYFNVMRGLF